MHPFKTAGTQAIKLQRSNDRRALMIVSVLVTGATFGGHAVAVAGAADPGPPRSALIVDGRSMAGAELATKAPKNQTGTEIVAGVLAGWGPVENFCFEGSNCFWKLRGTETVSVTMHPVTERIATISTDAKQWRTATSIGPGSTTRALKRTYRKRIVRRTTCGLNGFGGVSRGYVSNTRVAGERRFTFFELSASRQRIDTVWIGRGRAEPGSRC